MTVNITTWLLPPVVGAIIGLFTNWLAIKMIFRPLIEYRILGFRLPFTPGILPRERRRIASSLGETVAVDLLDEETIAQRLGSDAFKKSLSDAMLHITTDKLNYTYSNISNKNKDSKLILLIRQIIKQAAFNITSSQDFSTSINTGVSKALNLAAEMDISAVILRPETSSKIADAIASVLITFIKEAANQGHSISSFVQIEQIEKLYDTSFEKLYPIFLDTVRKFLNNKVIVKSMENSGAQIIQNAMSRLNTVQRFFLNIGKYDQSILDNMPETIKDFTESIIEILNKASTKELLRQYVLDIVLNFANKPLSSFDIFSDADIIAANQKKLSENILGVLQTLSPDAINSVLSSISKNQNLPEILTKIITNWLSSFFTENSTEGNTQSFVNTFFSGFSNSFAAKLSDVTLAESLAIDADKLSALMILLSEIFSTVISSESHSILKTIDVNDMIVSKINSLDMIDVEKMILRIVDKELGAITMFGGVLGALIGLAQTLFMLIK